MGRRNQIDIVRPLRDEFLIDFPKPGGGNLRSPAQFRDLVILAVDAVQIAAVKKDGTRSACPADARFLPVMESGPGYDGLQTAAAEPGNAGFIYGIFSVDPAAPGTDIA